MAPLPPPDFATGTRLVVPNLFVSFPLSTISVEGLASVLLNTHQRFHKYSLKIHLSFFENTGMNLNLVIMQIKVL